MLSPLRPTPAIGFGQVWHARHSPRKHRFDYSLAMPLVNPDSFMSLLSKSRWWSSQRWNLASYKRSDYHGDPGRSISASVRDTVERELGHRPGGDILMLAHPRYFGYCFNPIALYFCFDTQQQLVACMAEVTSTPWQERISYVMPVPEGDTEWAHSNDKAMHVSPFMPMDMQYHWRISAYAQHLNIRIDNFQNGERVFTASLNLDLQPVSTAALNRCLWRYPLMTMKVMAAIHWQALKLYLKGLPYISPPNKEGKE